MNSNMSEKKKKSWLLLALIVISCAIVGLIAGLWALNFESRAPLFEPRIPPPYDYPDNPPDFRGDFEFYYVAKTVISSINIVLASTLLAIYVTLYRENKSDFVFGLILFALVLLFYALVSNPIVICIFGYRPFGLGPFAVLPDMFATICLSIMLYLAFK